MKAQTEDRWFHLFSLSNKAPGLETTPLQILFSADFKLIQMHLVREVKLQRPCVLHFMLVDFNRKCSH